MPDARMFQSDGNLNHSHQLSFMGHPRVLFTKKKKNNLSSVHVDAVCSFEYPITSLLQNAKRLWKEISPTMIKSL